MTPKELKRCVDVITYNNEPDLDEQILFLVKENIVDARKELWEDIKAKQMTDGAGGPFLPGYLSMSAKQADDLDKLLAQEAADLENESEGPTQGTNTTN